MRLYLAHNFFTRQAEIEWDAMGLGNVPGRVNIHLEVVAVRVKK